MAEYPAVLWMFLFGLALPMMGIASFGYRALCFYFAVRDSCYWAAKSSTFTNAIAAAQTRFNTEVAAFNGISGTETLNVCVKPYNPPGPDQHYWSPAQLNGQINTGVNLYFLEEQGTGTIQPLFPTGAFLGLNIPGLSGPYTMLIKFDVYAENPNGLGN